MSRAGKKKNNKIVATRAAKAKEGIETKCSREIAEAAVKKALQRVRNHAKTQAKILENPVETVDDEMRKLRKTRVEHL